MIGPDALDALRAAGDPSRGAELLAYHKAERRYLGTPAAAVEAMARDLRIAMSLADRLALAQTLWDSDIHEARILAAKLLTQARMRPDDSAAWDLIAGWTAELDAWAIADHVGVAAGKRLMADPSRLDTVEAWRHDAVVWRRRAALDATRPFARLAHPSTEEGAARERVLDWVAGALGDTDWFMRKAVAVWLRDLSKHAPERTAQFLAEFGDLMKPWVYREAGGLLADRGKPAE